MPARRGAVVHRQYGQVQHVMRAGAGERLAIAGQLPGAEIGQELHLDRGELRAVAHEQQIQPVGLGRADLAEHLVRLRADESGDWARVGADQS